MVTWRNKAIGHGGYRPDQAELLHAMESQLQGEGTRERPGLGPALAAALDADPWAGLTLCILDDAGPGTRLVGANAIRPEHQGRHHQVQQAPLVLEGPTGRLALGPYASARRCDLCGYQDIFFYNGYRGKQGDPAGHHYLFLEYRAAHPLEQRWHQARDLLAERTRLATAPEATETIPLTGPAPDTPPDHPGGGQGPFGRRDRVALLDDIAVERRFLPALRAFLASADRGILWLTAPAHLGKTLFVRGLGPDLILCSRPRDGAGEECPRWVWDAVARTLGEAPTSRRLHIGLDHPGYQALLRDYLRHRLAPALVAGLAPLMGRWVRGEVPPAGPEDIGEDAGGDADLARALLELPGADGTPIADAVALLWRSAQPPGATAVPPLPRALLAAQSRALGALFAVLLPKAEGRFLYLAFLVDQLAERALDLESLPGLTTGEGLHRAYLDQDHWDQGLPPKPADLARRLLLVLAAAERVHTAYTAGGALPAADGAPTDSAAPLRCPGLDQPPVDGGAAPSAGARRALGGGGAQRLGSCLPEPRPCAPAERGPPRCRR